MRVSYRKLQASTFALALLVGGIVWISSIAIPQSAQALSGSSFQAGRIIDDGVFFRSSDLSVWQIQEFLNAKVPTCDNWGTQAYAGTTAGAYGSSKGYPPPYTCLKDLRQDTVSKPAELGLCNGYTAANNSAADIIYNVAQSCGINPKVLIVLLQKEQGLVTDDWPWSIQYRSATGYGCPDTAPCDSQYYGFFNQVYNAARQFKSYIKNSGSFNYVAYRNNNILFNPSASCGSSSIYIQNLATAALYNYTPYQPNQAALNNLYGSGDGCSAYGNRNFWRYFNDWFGSTFESIAYSYTLRLVGPITVSPAQPIPGQTATVSYTIQNFGSQAITPEASVLQCRLNTTTSCDPEWNAPFTINPGAQRTFSVSLHIPKAGSYTLTPYFGQSGVWYRHGSDIAGGHSLQLNVPKYVADLRMVNPVSVSPTQPLPGQTVTVSYTVQNFGSQPAIYQASVLQCRINTYTGCDPSWGGPITINAGAQHTFTNTFVAKAGSYTLVPYYMQNDTWYRYGVGTYDNWLPVVVPRYTADVRLTTPITSSTPQPIPGQPITVSYTVQNFGSQPAIYQASVSQCRINTYTGCDPSWDPPLTLSPGAQHTFSLNLPAVKAGTYTLTPYIQQNDEWRKYASNIGGENRLTISVPKYVADLRMVNPVSVSPTQPLPGQTVTVSYTVQNFGSQPAIYQASVLQCRINTYTGCDPSWGGPITINAGAQHTFTNTFVAKAGSYTLVPYYMQNDTWYRYGVGTYDNWLPVVVQ